MWKIAQGAARGKSHIQQGTPCQDKTYCCQRKGCTVAALADGAGSAKLSHYGAEVAVKAAALFISEHFDELYAAERNEQITAPLMQHVLQALHVRAQELNCAERDLASTLLVAALKGCRYLFVHLGDGLIVCSVVDEAKVASTPENGEFVNTTIFTTSPNAVEHVRVYRGIRTDIRGVLLMSDGSSTRLYNPRNRAISSALHRLITTARSMPSIQFEHMLVQTLEHTLQPATTDDCSMAIVAADFAPDTPFQNLPMEWQSALLRLGLRSCYLPGALRYYYKVLHYLRHPRSIAEVAAHMGLRRQIAEMLLITLMKSKLIRQTDATSYTLSANI